MVIVGVPNLGQRVVIWVLSCVVFIFHKVLSLRRYVVGFVVSSSVVYTRVRLLDVTAPKTVCLLCNN